MSGFPLVADSGQGVVAVCEGSRTGVRWCTYVRARRGGAGRGVGAAPARKEAGASRAGGARRHVALRVCWPCVPPRMKRLQGERVTRVWRCGAERAASGVARRLRRQARGPQTAGQAVPGTAAGGWRVCRPCRMRRLRVGCARHLWAMAHAHLLLSARGAAGGGGAAVSAGQRGACVQPGARPRLRVA